MITVADEKRVSSYPNTPRDTDGEVIPVSLEQARIDQMWREQSFNPFDARMSGPHWDGPPKTRGLTF